MPVVVPVELMWSEACPSTEEGRALLRDAAAEAGVGLELSEQRIENDDQANIRRFPGSPTFVIDGEDPFPIAPGTLYRHDACRSYARPDGAVRPLPAREELAGALRAAAARRATPEPEPPGPT